MPVAQSILTPDELTETSPGIYYSSRSLVAVDARVIEFLKDAARNSPLRRARLCAHPAPSAAQHDMLIVTRSESYVAPHRHPEKSESFLVLEGSCETLLFDEAGRVTDIFAMGPAGSGKPFFYRMPAMAYHALDVQSDSLVFVESAKGPFSPAQTQSAPWAPAPDQASEGKTFIAAARAAFAATQRT